MENNNKILKMFNKILGLDTANKGYIGLTSFDKVQKEEYIKTPVSSHTQTSFTGIIKRNA